MNLLNNFETILVKFMKESHKEMLEKSKEDFNGVLKKILRNLLFWRNPFKTSRKPHIGFSKGIFEEISEETHGSFSDGIYREISGGISGSNFDRILRGVSQTIHKNFVEQYFEIFFFEFLKEFLEE